MGRINLYMLSVTSLGVKENRLTYRQSPSYVSPHLCKFELICTFWSINASDCSRCTNIILSLLGKFPLLGIFLKNEYTPKLTDCVRKMKV